MTDWIQHEGIIRLTLWFALLIALTSLEQYLHPRAKTGAFWQRMRANFGLVLVDTLVLRLLFPVLAVGFALQNSLGLLHLLEWHWLLEFLLALLLLDLAIYWQHRLMHALPWLWSLHAVHHSDNDFDVTLALRFHPIEIALSMLYKLGMILLLGAGAEAVVVFETLLALGALLTHTRLQLPNVIERQISRFWITPSMHRVHHSIDHADQQKNFGTLLSCWDLIFNSYAKKAEQSRPFGLIPTLHDDQRSLIGLLRLPFKRRP
jgi:sterol desaturase/sphingolipid hydroxylase (fatty acid hydroxylase superfamily)